MQKGADQFEARIRVYLYKPGLKVLIDHEIEAQKL